jgi:hypothetical protein
VAVLHRVLPLVGYIAYRGVNGTTAVNMAINVIQISALVVFAIMAIAYRTSHPDGSVGWHLSNGTPVNYNVAQVNQLDDKGKAGPGHLGRRHAQVDDKKQPVWNTQDRQVTADDLDKAKNTNAVELASLTALGLGVGDPYPAWKADAKGNAIVSEGRQAEPRSLHPELQARGRHQRSRDGAGSQDV